MACYEKRGAEFLRLDVVLNRFVLEVTEYSNSSTARIRSRSWDHVTMYSRGAEKSNPQQIRDLS